MMNTGSEDNIQYMQRAHSLARSAKGKTFPNPAVGAVVVNNGVIVGEGATEVCGGLHAEKNAIIAAGEKAAGATLFVTLEPCCHYGRTPPCTDFIINAGIKKVFVSLKDPNPLVNGKGIRQLRDNGIDVSTGLLSEDAETLNEDFFWAVTRKRAWISLKLALTLDGKIADENGGSKWITSEVSRKRVHELRSFHTAVAVGRRTLELDNPQLTVRHVNGPSPARIVFSPDCNIPEKNYFCEHAKDSRSIVVVRGGAEREIVTRSGIEFWSTGEKDPESSLNVFLEMAFQQDITSIMVEGGQRLASRFLEFGLVNRVYLFYGNKILGSGKAGFSFLNNLPIDKCFYLEKIRFTPVDDSDFMISGIPALKSPQ